MSDASDDPVEALFAQPVELPADQRAALRVGFGRVLSIGRKHVRTDKTRPFLRLEEGMRSGNLEGLMMGAWRKGRRVLSVTPRVLSGNGLILSGIDWSRGILAGWGMEDFAEAVDARHGG